MTYNGKAHIEFGKVLCASQMCHECDFGEINKCVDVEIREVNTAGKEIMEAKEQIKKIRSR